MKTIFKFKKFFSLAGKERPARSRVQGLPGRSGFVWLRGRARDVLGLFPYEKGDTHVSGPSFSYSADVQRVDALDGESV